MTKRRVRFGLGAWIVIITALCIGVAVATLIGVQAQKRKAREARATCIANMRWIEAQLIEISLQDSIAPDYYAPLFRLLGESDTNHVCPLAVGTNRTLNNSYAYVFGDWTSPPTCRICPEEHVLP
jgi:hypothetical protein